MKTTDSHKNIFSRKLAIVFCIFSAILAFVILFPSVTFAPLPFDTLPYILWFVLSIIFLAVFVLFFYRSVYKPIMHLEFRLRTLYGNISPNRKENDRMTSVPLEVMLEEIFEYQQTFANRELTLQYLRTEAELSALQSQINPHFLFNTLESIRGCAEKNGIAEIADITEAISNLFRNSIQGPGTLATLADEIDNVRNYMLIQEFRFPGKFKFELNYPSNDFSLLQYQLPNLTIQPLVENSIFHGLELIPSGGRIGLDIYTTESRLVIRVTDNGCGIPKNRLANLNERLSSGEILSGGHQSSSTGTGIGLTNIHQRIQLQFGAQYGLTVASTLNIGTEVEVTLPLLCTPSDVQEREAVP